MQKYELVFKNENIKTFRFICLFLVIINAILFVILIFKNGALMNLVIALGCMIGYSGLRLFKSTTTKKGFYFDEWILFLIMMLWVAENNFVLAIANMILFLLYSVATDTTVYDFGSDRISQKNFPWKKYSWKQFSNVVLKDNILTLDFKNNRLLQAPVENNINEPDFNEYAKLQILHST
ncbi:MAG: hypothetical protein ABJA57_03915 [Ginsengibacter sp.]